MTATIINLAAYRTERAHAVSQEARRVIGAREEVPTVAYLRALEWELLSERALGPVSPDLVAECERVHRICGGVICSSPFSCFAGLSASW